jgi:hypothetical protein
MFWALAKGRIGDAVMLSAPIRSMRAFQTPQRIFPCTTCHCIIKEGKHTLITKFYFLLAASIASPFLHAMIFIL